MRKTIHYIDMFAGIGGFREGLTRAGDFVCMGHCEIDKYADRSYRALFDTEGEWFIDDARKADPETMPDFELLCGGFPCQACRQPTRVRRSPRHSLLRAGPTG